MLRKIYSPVSMYLSAAALIAGGILLLARPEWALGLLTRFLIVLAWLAVADAVVRLVTKRGKDRPTLGQAVLRLALAVFLTARPNNIRASMSLVFGVWVMINAVSKGIYLWQLFHTHSRGKIRTAFQMIVYVLFGLILLTHPVAGAGWLAMVLGIYCLIAGAFRLVDATRELLGTDVRGKRLKQRLRIKPPVLLTALMPMRLLTILDDPDEEAEIEQWTMRGGDWTDAEPNLEIFLHLSKNTAMGFGHMDIALGDTVYSYGCYDGDSNRLFGAISDGVMLKVNREEYIPFSLEYGKKRLIGYGVVLSEEQREAVERKISEFLGNSTRWNPPESNEEATELIRRANAEYYKVNEGPFKKYNVMTTNCVAMANILSGSGGVDLMNPQGIITPGTYAEFLDRQFRREYSIVVSRKVYR